jgi:hypothetical protein
VIGAKAETGPFSASTQVEAMTVGDRLFQGRAYRFFKSSTAEWQDFANNTQDMLKKRKKDLQADKGELGATSRPCEWYPEYRMDIPI